ncbi:arylsulfatase B-like isoform X1 [Dermacentor albipictus]|uniref:arylsulfatase B-like isoform X1 n=1 Tax=Dermacentor albipictus TaxID=60249 RepID=UPI0031FE19EB
MSYLNSKCTTMKATNRSKQESNAATISKWFGGIGLSCLALLVMAMLSKYSSKRQPDIVVFIADDLGWDDVSFHGSSQIPTPNLDALAADGIILNNFYAQPSCSPSRAAFMTGRYPIRTGMQHYPIDLGEPWGLSMDERILPEYLRELGYETRLVGKWHLGCYKKSMTPTYRGFDSFYGFHYGEEDYYSHNATFENHTGLDFWLNTEPRWSDSGIYSTTLYTERAQYLIRNRKKPLFLVVSYQAAHGTAGPELLQAPPENIEKFPYIQDKKRKIFAGVVDAMDHSVGQIFKTMGETGMLENVVMLFTSDNGGTPFGYHSSRSFNWPLRGAKFSLWEGSTRVAAFVWSPLLERTRRVSSQLMHLTDWFATFYKIAGGDESSLELVDGLDMWQCLSTGSDSVRQEILYNVDFLDSTKSFVAAIRDSRYKLVLDAAGAHDNRHRTIGGHRPSRDLDELLARSTTAGVLKDLYKVDRLNFPKGWRQRATISCGGGPSKSFSPNDTVFLFDIVQDPCELNNVAEKHPKIVASLRKRIDAYRAVVVPARNQPKDPASFPEYHKGIWAPWVDSS